ncbi:hypothetical protein RRG08_055516 [Elysia crispata]|uniref:Uncharacterized protein n=1 Tax=Elysia crispata TaxID=231223 RepID=A0AAE1E2G0_9GAST|nr:hypothetical protein RRG08_055516 [Elysia crispata]
MVLRSGVTYCLWVDSGRWLHAVCSWLSDSASGLRARLSEPKQKPRVSRATVPSPRPAPVSRCDIVSSSTKISPVASQAATPLALTSWHLIPRFERCVTEHNTIIDLIRFECLVTDMAARPGFSQKQLIKCEISQVGSGYRIIFFNQI